MAYAVTPISTTLTQVSVGSVNNIWGVDASHNIYQSTDQGKTWTQIPGELKYVSAAADGTVWGVDPASNIYLYNGKKTWTKIPGQLDQISVGSASLVWGVNGGSNAIYQYNGDTTWTQIPGQLIQVSVGSDGTVCGVGSGSSGPVYNYSLLGTAGWHQLPDSNQNNAGNSTNGAFVQVVAVPARHIWGLAPDGHLYTFTIASFQAGPPWSLVSLPQAKSFSVASDGTCALIDATGTTWRNP